MPAKTYGKDIMRVAFRAILYGLCYFCLAWVSSWFASRPFGFVSFWLPSGLALACLMASEKKAWPFLLACQIAANLCFDAVQGRPLALSVFFSLGNCLEPLAGASIALGFARGRDALSSLKGTIVLIAGAVCAGPLLSAALGWAGLMAVAGSAFDLAGFVTWWSGDALGVLVLGFPLISWFSRPQGLSPSLPKPLRALEMLLLSCLAAFLIWFAFVRTAPLGTPYKFLLYPVLLWVGLRFPMQAVLVFNLVYSVSVQIAIVFFYPRMPDLGLIERIDLPMLIQSSTATSIMVSLFPCVLISELRRKDREAREKDALYRDLVMTSRDLIWQSDGEGRFTFLNAEWEAVLGYPIDSMLGKDYRDFLADGPEDRERPEGIREVKAREMRFAAKDGRTVWLSVNARPILGRDGARIGMRGTAHDLSERKRLEDAEFTAQKLESLGIMAGGIAHDFNNLLGGIFGYMELLQAARTLEQAKDYARKAMAPYARAKDIARQLLTFSRGGAPAKTAGRIEDVLRVSVGLALAGSKVSPRLEIPRPLPEFAFDPGQLSQVFQSIAAHARESMPGGGILEARAEAWGDPPVAKISLADTGLGFEPEALPHVFDPFYPANRAGTRLGLAICYSIIAKHGGSIGVESVPGERTVFTVLLPMDGADRLEVEPGAALAGAHRGSGRALVMDDEEYMRDICMSALSGMGYSAQAVPDGEAAVRTVSEAIAAGEPFRLVLLDLTIPGGMGGREAARLINELPGPIPVLVAASGYATDPVIADPLGYGFDDAIAKPFRAEELERLLERAMR
jgi:PAS domain S-box-containing protein